MADPLRYSLHPRVQDLWFWQSLIAAAAIALPGVLAGLLSGWWVISLASVLVGGMLFSLALRYCRRYAAQFRCELSDDGLLVARGVWWRSERFIPRTRIQHTDVKQGPIARHYQMATLKVYTAGTHLGELEVDGLTHVDALMLRDSLLGRDGRDSV
jgi:membrane protein YdbS with pleckstrin-like domain